MKILRFHNHKGLALVASYTIIAVLATLGAGFISAGINELNQVRRFQDSTASFWLAEAGLAEAVFQIKADPDWDWQSLGTQTLGNGYYEVSVQDSSEARVVTVTGTVGDTVRQVSAEFPFVNQAFTNTLTCGGDMHLGGLLAKTEVYDKARLNGTFSKDWGTTAYFEDKVENLPESETTIKYPDADNNGTPDEFADFKAFNQAILANYDASEIVYLPQDATANVYPNKDFIGKRIVYVEGSTAGSGDVNIFFDATWQDDQDLTIISTGTVDYVEPLQFQTDSRLNVIAWDEYHEYSIFLSTHDGVTYAHDEAKYYDIFEYSVTEGNIIANEGINETEVVSLKRFYFDDRAMNGDIPAGFEGLECGTPVLASEASNWQEVIQ